MEQQLSDLVRKYKEGKASEEDLQILEKYIETGEVELEALGDIYRLYQDLDGLETPAPSEKMTGSFYAFLATTSKTKKARSQWFTNLWISAPGVRWAYTFGLLAVGIAIGWFFSPNGQDHTEIHLLSAEVKEMKEMMMLSLLEKESTSDRLKAVSLSSELPGASQKVTEALLQTLNSDENVNVRLAALEALLPYSSDPSVRTGLIASIARQESPLVQISLAETMVALQEKNSVDPLKKLLEREETPAEVKEKIEESIRILI